MPRVRECRVTPHAIDGNADQSGTVSLEFARDLVVQRQLIAAHRTPIRGVEHENHPTSTEL
jgi:hypothetical protein